MHAKGFSLRHVEVIGSTNAQALDALRAGQDRLWIIADQQESGRGRHGRIWTSPPGNLYASLALDAPCDVQHLPQLGFVAGVALAEAVAQFKPDLAMLKWPNDLMIGPEKCAGILLEGGSSAGKQGVAIGIGVNIAAIPEGLGRPATALAKHIDGLTRDGLFSALAATMEDALALFDRGAGFAAIREKWLALAMPIGARITVSAPSGRREGAFLGLDGSGAMLLETGEGQETILAGDVFLVEEASLMSSQSQ